MYTTKRFISVAALLPAISLAVAPVSSAQSLGSLGSSIPTSGNAFESDAQKVVRLQTALLDREHRSGKYTEDEFVNSVTDWLVRSARYSTFPASNTIFYTVEDKLTHHTQPQVAGEVHRVSRSELDWEIERLDSTSTVTGQTVGIAVSHEEGTSYFYWARLHIV